MPDISLNDEAALLVVDVQDKLIAAMDDQKMERRLHATRTLVQLADETGARLVYTEQYPDGLGTTESSLRQLLEDRGAERVEKKSFDACSAPEFRDVLIDLPRRVVVCGMETHVCVYTTVRELIDRRHDVVVPFDATISRRDDHHDNGLRMMEQCGATIANYETLVFDALQTADHPAFKKFSKKVQEF